MNKIPLEQIVCVDNRKMEGIEELAANIAEIGMLQPILLGANNNPEKPYVVIDGRRRFRALEMLGRFDVLEQEYTLYTGNDESIDKATFCANVVRQNLTLGEEVEQMRALTGTDREIAKILGKSESYVLLRRNLGNLNATWSKVLQNPDRYPQWTAGCLELIAREPESMQKELEYLTGWGHVTIKELRDKIAECHRLLSTAIFDKSECEACLKRSGAQSCLFSDYDAKSDTCLDGACFRKKSLKIVKEKIKDSGLIAIRGEKTQYGSEEYKFADKIKAQYTYNFDKIRAPKKGETANAMIVSGDGIGSLVVAVPFDKKEKRSSSAPEPKPEKTLKDREAEFLGKRLRVAYKALQDALEKDTVEAFAERAKYNEKELRVATLKLAMWYGLPDDNQRHLWNWRNPEFRDTKEFDGIAYRHALDSMYEIIRNEAGGPLASINIECGSKICELTYLQWETFCEIAKAEVPEPKSLIAARLQEKAQKKGGKKCSN